MGNRVVNFIPIKQGIYEISSSSNGDLGSVLEFEDGRKFVYSLNGTDTLTPGAVIQGPIEDSNDEDIACAVTNAVGDTIVTITTARNYAANELKDGWLVVAEGTAHLGHGRKIKSHPASTSGDSLVITLYDALTDVITAATDTITVMENPFNGVMLQNSGSDGPVLGVAPLDVTAAYYFWLQIAGPCPVISGEAMTPGVDADAKAATITKADGADDETIGKAMRTCDSGDAGMVWLNLG